MSEYIMAHTGEELDEAIAKVNNGYILPEGTKNIKTNGVHNVAQYNEVNVDVPSEGGNDVQEIFYADFSIDLSTFTLTGTSTSYQEIVSQIESGKYVVARGQYALISSPINIGYFPLSAYIPEQDLLIFSGLVQSYFNNQVVVLSLTLELYSTNRAYVRARIVSTTDIN